MGYELPECSFSGPCFLEAREPGKVGVQIHEKMGIGGKDSQK